MASEEWSQRSNAELVIAALVGNLEAFGELVRRFRPAVSAVVSGIVKSRESTEDVIQDTFLLAFKALPRLKDVESFPSWLCAIARNRAIRYQQRASRTVPYSILDTFILQESKAFDTGYSDNPASILEQEESCSEVRDALDELPEEYQVVLRLQYWSEMPLRSIAEFLNMPLSVVKWRIYKGKQALRKRLERKWKEEHNDRGKRIEKHKPDAESYSRNGTECKNDGQ